MATVEEAIATFERNIAAQTGAPVDAWASRVRDQGFARRGELLAWLRGAYRSAN